MEHTRRFVFRGNASAASGRIHRPTDVLIDVNGASSLTVAGGISRSQVAAQTFGPYVRFVRASTLAEGAFDDERGAIALTNRRMNQDGLTTTTRVSAEVDGLAIGSKPELTVSRLRAALVARSGPVGGEPPFELPGDVSFGDTAIDAHGLVVEIDFDVFRQCTTYAAIRKAATGLRESSGTVFATIVKSIRWAGAPYPGATIDHHSVIVPDFGTIFFGEILISSFSRRLTMLRLELGSPVGGFVACAEVETNGIWAP